jgi:hypothetical protein
MVSEECLARIREHVTPIKGLHPWTAQAIYTALAVCPSKQGQASVAEGQRCWVSVAELAARTGMCRRNIERYLPVLEAAGVLKIVHAHDALHRPVASQYVFTYPHTQSGDIPTPESANLAPLVSASDVAATPTSTMADSRVGTDSKSPREPVDSDQEGVRLAEGEEREEHRAGTAPLAEGTSSTSEEAARTDPRWEHARQILRREVSAAAFSAWLEPLWPLCLAQPGNADDPTPRSDTDLDTTALSFTVGAGGAAGSGRRADGTLVLACSNAFQREQIRRRYHAGLEAALGGPVELVIAPAQASAAPPGA